MDNWNKSIGVVFCYILLVSGFSFGVGCFMSQVQSLKLIAAENHFLAVFILAMIYLFTAIVVAICVHVLVMFQSSNKDQPP